MLLGLGEDLQGELVPADHVGDGGPVHPVADLGDRMEGTFIRCSLIRS